MSDKIMTALEFINSNTSRVVHDDTTLSFAGLMCKECGGVTKVQQRRNRTFIDLDDDLKPFVRVVAYPYMRCVKCKKNYPCNPVSLVPVRSAFSNSFRSVIKTLGEEYSGQVLIAMIRARFGLQLAPQTVDAILTSVV